MKVLVGRIRNIKITLSTVAPTKTTGEFTTRRILAFLRECECEMVDLTIR